MASKSVEPWLRLLPADPRPWLLESGEPAARWVTLTRLLDREGDDPEAKKAKEASLADPGTRELIGRLHDWEKGITASGHNSPQYTPNLLHLLADLGLGAGDHPRIERFLGQLLAHQDEEGRFQAKSKWRGQERGRWGALLCDAHCIVEALVRFGRAEDPRTRRGRLSGWPPTAPGPRRDRAGRAWRIR
jgi:hypothetical protein